MTENYKKKLELDYAIALAIAESKEFNVGYYVKDLRWYDNNEDLMNKHHRFLNYMHSTFTKYILHRTIIIYYFKKVPCSISVLNRTVDISRTSLKKIIDDSIAEGWVFTKVNKLNKRQYLVLPTDLRIEFWLLYSKSRYENYQKAGVDSAYERLKLFNDHSQNLNSFLLSKNQKK